MDQITMCNEGVARNEEPTENRCLTMWNQLY